MTVGLATPFAHCFLAPGKRRRITPPCTWKKTPLAAGTYRIVESSRDRIKLASEENADWPCEKVVSFFSHETSCEIRCEFTLRRTAPGTASVLLGMETVVNFLAPSAPDRYFESAGKRFPLRWSAAVPASELRVIDEWQRVAL